MEPEDPCGVPPEPRCGVGILPLVVRVGHDPDAVQPGLVEQIDCSGNGVQP